MSQGPSEVRVRAQKREPFGSLLSLPTLLVAVHFVRLADRFDCPNDRCASGPSELARARANDSDLRWNVFVEIDLLQRALKREADLYFYGRRGFHRCPLIAQADRWTDRVSAIRPPNPLVALLQPDDLRR